MQFEVITEEFNVDRLRLNEIYKDLVFIFSLPTLLLFEGQAGVGKTESVRMICEILGYRQIASPSFAIIHQYENQTSTLFSHVDLYRLNDDDDLESSGFWDLLSNEDHIVAIEWSEKMDKEFLPLNWQKLMIHIEVGDQEHLRNIHIRRIVD